MPRTHDHAGPPPTGRRALAAALAALACAGIAAALAPAAAPAQPKAKLQRALDRVVAAGAPGATLLVRDGDRTVRLASGYGDLARRTPIRVAHRARAGGVTKSFTAAVVLQLAGEGR